MDDLETVPEEEPKERERCSLSSRSWILFSFQEPAEVTESCRPPLVFPNLLPAPIHLTIELEHSSQPMGRVRMVVSGHIVSSYIFLFSNFVVIVMIGSAFFSENRMKGECRWWRVWSTQGDFNARSGK
jgi:hypothetical protein